MQKVFPHLWFDKEAKDAADFYTSVFPRSRITDTTVIKDTPSGDCDIITFEIWETKFMAINAGPLFKFNPSISFMVNFDPLFFEGDDRQKEAGKKLEEIWAQLAEGGKILMPLDKYPFSEKFGWVVDKFGVSWQLILPLAEGEPRPPIVPALMFTGKNAGKAEEAINYYTTIFNNSRKGALYHYEKDEGGNKAGSVMFADFMLEDVWFAAMDSYYDHQFNFNEAISFVVNCRDQDEIDYYWKLSADPKSEQCGWLKDKFGLSWQVSPAEMEDMLNNGSPEQIENVTQTFLPMKKLEIDPIRRAFKGEPA